MRRNKRWMAWVAAGFLAVYTAAMGLSLCLSADRYRETFRMAYQTKEIQAREELRTLEMRHYVYFTVYNKSSIQKSWVLILIF